MTSSWKALSEQFGGDPTQAMSLASPGNSMLMASSPASLSSGRPNSVMGG